MAGVDDTNIPTPEETKKIKHFWFVHDLHRFQQLSGTPRTHEYPFHLTLLFLFVFTSLSIRSGWLLQMNFVLDLCVMLNVDVLVMCGTALLVVVVSYEIFALVSLRVSNCIVCWLGEENKLQI